MRTLFVAVVAAVFLALFAAVPGAAAQVSPYPYGPIAPFYVPQAGIDPFGRPFALAVAGWYGSYNGLGYPVVVNTVGVYAGVPIVRTWLGFVPVPAPVAYFAPFRPPVAVPLVP